MHAGLIKVRVVEAKARCNINHIDKLDFLAAFPELALCLLAYNCCYCICRGSFNAF